MRLLLGAAACGVLGFAAVAAWPTSQEGGGAGGKASASPTSTLPYSDAFPDPGKAARCHGAECTGRSPEAMACLSPRTIGSWRAKNGQRVEIRYGEACRAGWAKISKSHVGDRLSISLAGAEDRPQGDEKGNVKENAKGNPKENTQRTQVRDELDSLDYLSTPMVATDAPSALRLCLEPAGGGAKECFGR